MFKRLVSLCIYTVCVMAICPQHPAATPYLSSHRTLSFTPLIPHKLHDEPLRTRMARAPGRRGPVYIRRTPFAPSVDQQQTTCQRHRHVPVRELQDDHLELDGVRPSAAHLLSYRYGELSSYMHNLQGQREPQHRHDSVAAQRSARDSGLWI